MKSAAAVTLLLAATAAAQLHNPRTTIQAERWLNLDFPAVSIGVAEYDDGPTGATVFHFPKGAKVAVDVRGGAPGTINTDFLRLSYDNPFVNAITFAGGSTYGLSAATGVAEAIRSTQAHPNDLASVATVLGAIIFDIGPRRFSTVVPDGLLGQAAFRAAIPGRFPLGAHGAGRFAMQSGYFGDSARVYSGEGAAFKQIGPTKIAVFTIVNALGAIVDREGNVVRCQRRPCGRIADRLATRLAKGLAETTNQDGPTEATTLTLVVTNEKLPIWALQRMAIQVHTSMARAIQPFHTSADGDVLFAATTDEVENADLSFVTLGVHAAEVAWDAVLASVPELDPPDDRPAMTLGTSALARLVGSYELHFPVRAEVNRSEQTLTITMTKDSLYGAANQPISLVPVSPTEFRMENGRGDRIRFDVDASGISSGFTINPGHWPIPAHSYTP